MDSFVVGVDIGGTGTKFGIVDNVGNVLFSSEMSTKKHEQVHTFIDELNEKNIKNIEVKTLHKFFGLRLGDDGSDVAVNIDDLKYK